MSLRTYWRFVAVVRQFLPLALTYARDRRRFLLFGRSRSVSSQQRRDRAERLLQSLLTLGPTFIKLGQLLSTRPDVLPPEYVEEFSKLQDSVPPADWEKAQAVIEDELGTVEERFSEFNTEAISGASLGQVYYAEVGDDPVAVKVRRPGVEQLVESDLQVVQWLLPIILYFVDDARSFSLETLADEFATTIREEMDYEREAEMLTEIRGNFTAEEGIRIPPVVQTHSTRRILTMEYIEGTKINDVEELDRRGVDRTALAENLERAYFQMIVEDGVYHADPHPGNLAVQDDGTLVFYDFGMSGRVDAYLQDRIIDFYMAVADQDIDAILDALIAMGTLSPEADRQVMAEVMELAIADARGEDIGQYRVQQIIQKVEDTIYEFPLRLPSNLALVLRVATVVEGVCVTLDPEFDFIDVATDFLREEGYLEESAREFVRDRVEEVGQAGRSAVRIPPKLETTLDRIDRDDFYVRADLEDSDGLLDALAARLVLGLFATGGFVSTAVLYSFSTVRATLLSLLVTLLVLFGLYRSFRQRQSIRAKPQFTRQNMRQRDETGQPDSPAIGADGPVSDEEAKSPTEDRWT
ncbi:AarF/ABC1/UbiB kinase family protein [Halorhabdus sp. CBA1104]|uniref:ABC1 kinase family protein n=1 Tax=Halorhabdus sp. CBA1104 TaxID=1380432 RepID=UPI0012B3CEB8|nr:AarF/ABC1/UbiB kinase family protein [Halorhabdus sp. CBA1104]QGN06102.1 AarF/ABC1/UbiB kinase family protein [Halorhabdus sp. CBA1104]